MATIGTNSLLDLLIQRLGYGANADASAGNGPPMAAPPMQRAEMPRAHPPMIEFDPSRAQPQPAQPMRVLIGNPGQGELDKDWLATNPQRHGARYAMPANEVQDFAEMERDFQRANGAFTPDPDLQQGQQTVPKTPPADADPRSQFTRQGDPAPGVVPPMPSERIFQGAQTGVPYTGSIDRPPEGENPMPGAPPPMPTKRAAPQGSFLSDAAQFVSGMRTGGLLTDLAGGYKSVEGRNATREFLSQKGVPEGTIAAMEANPLIFQPVMADLFSNKTQVINNKLVRSVDGKVIADFSDAATKGPDVKDFTLPDGSKVSAVWNARTGRHELPNGQPIPSGAADTAGIPPGVDPKKYRETMATKLAEENVKARVDLPEALRNADFLLKQVDAVIGNDKDGRPYEAVVGGWDGLTPNILPGARNAQAKINQLKGQAFLQAYQSLRGTGAISNTEGAKAEAAMARLQEQRVDDADYGQALREFRQEVVNLAELAKRKAAGNYQPLPGAGAPGAAATGGDLEGRTATGPDGSKVINRGGKWVPFNG